MRFYDDLKNAPANKAHTAAYIVEQVQNDSSMRLEMDCEKSGNALCVQCEVRKNIMKTSFIESCAF